MAELAKLKKDLAENLEGQKKAKALRANEKKESALLHIPKMQPQVTILRVKGSDGGSTERL